MSSYYDDAKYDAQQMVLYYLDEIIEQLTSKGKASTDLYNDYRS